MSLQLAAQHLASRGRGPDTTLVHMAPHEVAGLQALARAQGGSLTINPDTGLAEAGFLSDLFKAALPMAAGFALGPAGFGLMSSLGAGAAVGGITALASGSLAKGITAGLGAYGGSELGSGLSNFGAEAAANQAVPALTSGADTAATQQYANQFTAARDLASADKLGSFTGGVKAAFEKPSAFVGSMGGIGSLAKPALAAAAPFLSLAPKTDMPATGSQNTAFIRTMKKDPRTGAYVQDEAVPASEWGNRPVGSYNFYGANRMAEGGLAEHFKTGGTTLKKPSTTTQTPALTGDSLAAYNYLMGTGANPLLGGSPLKPITPPVEEKKDIDKLIEKAVLAPSIKSVIEDGGGSDKVQKDGWDTKTVGEKAAFWGENPNWADLHAKALSLVPFSTQAKLDELAALALAKSTAQAEADRNPNAFGGGYGVDGARTSPAGAMIAANPMAIDPQQAQAAMQAARDAAAVEAAQANAAAQRQAAEQMQSQIDAQTAAAQAARDAATSLASPTATAQSQANAQAQIDAAAVSAAQANAASQRQAAEQAQAQIGAQAQADQAARDVATSLSSPTASSGFYGREGGGATSGPSADSSMGFGIEGGGYGGMSGDGNGGGGGADGSGGGPGDSGGPRARGGMVGHYALGGITALAQGGMSGLGSYSDGGRLLRGPGDGVSDDIPAHIGRDMQPARLADGEFVVPARIVSELGNGSTEAGARQLYKMMERIQAGRAKTTGKNKVAVNSRAAKHLPA